MIQNQACSLWRLGGFLAVVAVAFLFDTTANPSRASAVAGAPDLPKLKISENKHFLITDSGQPFFWLGDTSWELFHRLNREDAERYLKNRAEKGFNVVQAVALAEFDG